MVAIPPLLYSFWAEPDPPELVAACLDTLRRTAGPEWQLRVISRSERHGLPPPPASSLTVAQESDWYRLAALAATGGVYLDASCIALQPLGAWVDRHARAVQGYAFHPDGEGGDTLESWAVAAPAGCALAARWRDEFGAALSQGVEAYCRDKQREGYSTAALSRALPYLAIHLAFRVARAADPDAPVVLRSAVAPGGPLHYLRAGGWEPLRAVSALFASSADELCGTPLLKLRACDRECVPPLRSLGGGSWLARFLCPALGGVSSRVEWLLSSR